MPENQASTLELLVGVARGGGPLQRQVEDQLRAAIRSGRLVAGERLPASRVLAADLGVSRGVVSDAYVQLAAEGWLVVAPRSRPRVAAAASGRGAAAGVAATADGEGGGGARRRARRSRRAGCAPRRGATAVRGAAADARRQRGRERADARSRRRSPGGAGRSVRYDLRPGRPDLARFPRADWVRSSSAAVRGGRGRRARLSADRGRDRAARGRRRVPRARARDRRARRGRDPVRGRRAGVRDVAEALGPVRLAVEDPGHEGIRGLFAKRGLEPVPMRVDEDGIVVDELPDDARAVLLTPAHQFPTGAVLSAERRARCSRWAAEHDVLIIEDDYDAEYRYDRAPIGALQGLRPDLVAHVGSVSKTLAPALRLGWLIAPPRWRERAAQRRASPRPRPARARAARARRLHHPRRLRPPPAPQRPRLPPPPRRADRRAHRARFPARPSAAPPPACTSPSTSRAPTSRRWSPPARAAGVIVDGITPHRVAPGPSGPADQLRRGPRRRRRPRRGTDRLSARRRRRRTACGRRARSTARPSGAPGRADLGIAEREDVATCSPSLTPTAAAIASASDVPFGHEPMPSLCAASIMFWAARPASSPSGPAPATTIATSSAAPRTFAGSNTAAATALAIAQHDEAPLLAVARASRQAAGLEDPAHGVVGQRPVVVGADLALGDDGQEGVHQGAGSVISAPPIRAVASGVRCVQLTFTVTPATVKVALAAP